MNKLITIFVLLFLTVNYSQQMPDKMELRDGQIFLGKVEKILIEIVEFKDSETGLIYEKSKKDIRYIQLSNGKILTFEEYYETPQKSETQKQQPYTTEEEKSTSTLAIVIGLVIVVGGFIVLIQ